MAGPLLLQLCGPRPFTQVSPPFLGGRAAPPASGRAVGPLLQALGAGGPGVTAEVGQKRESSPPRALELWRLSLLSEGPEPQPGSSRVAR